MTKEKHIQVGDFDYFTQVMQQNGVERHTPQQNPVGIELYGMPIVVNKYVPKDRALLVSAEGKILQIYDL